MAKNVSLFGITVFGQYLTHIFIVINILTYFHCFERSKKFGNVHENRKIIFRSS